MSFVAPHFPPLTAQLRFSPERVIVIPRLTPKLMFNKDDALQVKSKVTLSNQGVTLHPIRKARSSYSHNERQRDFSPLCA